MQSSSPRLIEFKEIRFGIDSEAKRARTEFRPINDTEKKAVRAFGTENLWVTTQYGDWTAAYRLVAQRRATRDWRASRLPVRAQSNTGPLVW